MLERRAEHETHSKRVFSSRRRASFTTPNSHIPHMHQLVCLGDSVLRAVCWGTFSFIKNQSCPNPHFLLGPSGWISWVTLPIGKEADYVHIGLVSSQVHLMLKNKKTHPRPSLLHFVPFFFLLLWFCWLNLSQSLSLSKAWALRFSIVAYCGFSSQWLRTICAELIFRFSSLGSISSNFVASDFVVVTVFLVFMALYLKP